MKRKRPIIGLFLIWRFSKYIMKKIFKILCFILFLYAGTALFFSDHFYPGTNLNGEKVSLRDKESSKRILQKKVINHNITIIQPDGSKTELDGDTYDLHLNTDADIKNALYLQHSFLWPVNIWKKHDLKQELNVEYDNKELSRIINSLTFMHKENQTYPKNAKPVYGEGNPNPVFLIHDFYLSPRNGHFFQRIGQNAEHIKLYGNNMDAIGFDMAERFINNEVPKQIDIIGTLSFNYFNNRKKIQIEIFDYLSIKKEKTPFIESLESLLTL